MDASALDKATSILAKEISKLEVSIDALEKWLWISSVAVAVGVVLEIAFLIHEYLEDRTSWHRGILVTPSRPNLRILSLEITSVLLVVAGVVGELGVGVISGARNANLRSKNSRLVSLVREKAGNAQTAAVVANDRATDAINKAGDLAALLKTEQDTTARFQQQANESAARLDKATADLANEEKRLDLDMRRRGPRARLLDDAHIRSDPRLFPSQNTKQRVLILSCTPQDTETDEAATRLDEELAASHWWPQVDRIECRATIGILSPAIFVSTRSNDTCRATAEALSKVLIDALLLPPTTRSLVIVGDHPKSPSDAPNTIIVQMNLHSDR